MKKFSITCCKNSAFTLAEVLITLGIIGVVAAITMPVLITNYKKEQTVTQLKKAYSEMHQAVKLSEIDNGDNEFWDYNLGAKDFFDKYIKNYLKYNTEQKYTDYKNKTTYKYLNGTECQENLCIDNNSYYVLLSNGSVVAISNHIEANYKAYFVDINGHKGPNVLGKDFFAFSIQPKYKVVPYGFGNAVSGGSFGTNYNRSTLTDTTNVSTCNKQKKGLWCASLIMYDGWQIKDDYPW